MAGYLMVSVGGEPDKPWRYRGADTIQMDRSFGRRPIVARELTKVLPPGSAVRRRSTSLGGMFWQASPIAYANLNACTGACKRQVRGVPHGCFQSG
jgi:hypothetical protein